MSAALEPETIPLPPPGVLGYVVARIASTTSLTHASVTDRETAEAEAELWRRKALTSAKFVVCEVREVVPCPLAGLVERLVRVLFHPLPVSGLVTADLLGNDAQLGSDGVLAHLALGPVAGDHQSEFRACTEAHQQRVGISLLVRALRF